MTRDSLKISGKNHVSLRFLRSGRFEERTQCFEQMQWVMINYSQSRENVNNRQSFEEEKKKKDSQERENDLYFLASPSPPSNIYPRRNSNPQNNDDITNEWKIVRENVKMSSGYFLMFDDYFPVSMSQFMLDSPSLPVSLMILK